MKIPDFLIYYLNTWYKKGIYKLKWSTPLEMTCYVVALATMSFVWSLCQVYIYSYLKDYQFQFSLLPIIILGLGLIQLYKYIYIKRNRIEGITSMNFLLFKNWSENQKMIIAMVIVFIVILSPCFVFMFFVPFGINKMHGH
jgi:hypothetical protein